MMQFYTLTDYVDVDRYEEYLNLNGEIYADLDEIMLYAQKQRYRAMTLYRLCLKYMNLHSKSGYSSIGTASVVDYLQRNEEISHKNFRKKGVAGDSLDKKKILIPLLQNGYAVDFLEMFIEYKESDNRSNNMSTLLRRIASNKKHQGWDSDLTPVPFTANRDVNLRFNYSNENIISFPKDMKSVIKSKSGYVLAWGDFAQSDARIAYNLLLKDETNIPYIRAFPDDVYAGFANWVNEFKKQELQQRLGEMLARNKTVFKEAGSKSDTFNVEAIQKQLAEWMPFTGFKTKAERDLYKVYVLQTIYGTRNHKVAKASKFITALGKVLDSCSKYKRFWEDIVKRASFGIPVKVHCYMGHVEHVAAFDGSRLNETLFKCLNYPCQGGSSEIIILTVNRILEKFYSLGYTSDDIHVYYIRHDEPVFQMKKTLMKDSWILKDFGIIQVDDWIPLRLDFSFGRTYTEKDKDLMDEFSLSSRINADKLSVCKPVNPNRQYYPLENLLEISVCITRMPGEKDVLSVYNVNKHSGAAKTIAPLEGVEDSVVIKKFVDKYLTQIYAAGYQQLVVYNSLNCYEDVIDGSIPVVRLYRPLTNRYTFNSNVIGAAAMSAISGKANDIVEQNRAFLSSLTPCPLFKGICDEST